MKIDLNKFGLTEESTYKEIQAALNAHDFYIKADLDTAAANARKAAEAEAKKKTQELLKGQGKLSEEEMKEYTELKKGKKIANLKENEILKKLDDIDFDLIVAGHNLADKNDEELKDELKVIQTKYATKFTNSIPKKVIKTEEAESEEDESDKKEPGVVGKDDYIGAFE